MRFPLVVSRHAFFTAFQLEFYELLLAGIEVLVLLNQGLGVEVVAVGELEVSFDLGRVRFGHRVRQHFQTAVEGVDVLLV